MEGAPALSAVTTVRNGKWESGIMSTHRGLPKLEWISTTFRLFRHCQQFPPRNCRVYHIHIHTQSTSSQSCLMSIPTGNLDANSSPTSETPPRSLLATTRKSLITTHETHPIVLEKDKSVHPEHGVIHYPFYFGGISSCVSVCCTQPLGVGEYRLR